MSRRQIVDAARSSPAGDVVLTGGEPLLWPGVAALVEELRSIDRHVTMETAGTIDRQVTPDLLSLSPKLSDSGPTQRRDARWSKAHEARRMPLEIMRRLIERAVGVQVKFVATETLDWDELQRCVDGLKVEPADVWIMPQAVDVETLDAGLRRVKAETERRGFRIADRGHLRWYGNRRGT